MKGKSPAAAFIGLGTAFVAIGAGSQRGLLPVGLVLLVVGITLMAREQRAKKPK